jgi:hypothetical protein
MENQATGLPLSALLSQILTAFTIELDNEFEHQMPHRTARLGLGRTPRAPYAPWLVSMVMWFNCMQFVDEKGITVGDLTKAARTYTNLNGMARWGYLTIEPATGGQHRLVRAKPAGLKAREIWKPLFREIETRWQERFGEKIISLLKQTLSAITSQIELNLPYCLPILGYGLFSKTTTYNTRLLSEEEGGLELSLPVLLSRVLLSLTIAFEQQSKLSLAISGNILRVLDEFGIKLSALPGLTGVSKEAISMAVGVLQKKQLIRMESNLQGPGKTISLTEAGLVAQQTYQLHLAKIEDDFCCRFGVDIIKSLRDLLEDVISMEGGGSGLLMEGIKPYADGWRAFVKKTIFLPHYPMTLHRGGYPDGS